MRPLSLFGLLSFFLFYSGSVKGQDSLSQDTILLMSGQQLIASVVGVGKPLINYSVKKKNKMKIRQIDSYRVFSVRFGDERGEIVTYKPDTAKGRYRSIEETRSFVYGQQDALNHFKGGVYRVLGLAIGIPNGYYVGGDAGSVFVIPGPAAFSIPFLLNKHIPKKAVRNQKYLEDQHYRDGFKRVIVSKRFFSVLTSSAVGTVAGYLYYQSQN